MNNPWYRFFKFVLIGPFLRVWNRPTYEGGEKVPEQGAAIMASNHLAVMDSFFFPLVLRRQITFLAKKEYWMAPTMPVPSSGSSSGPRPRCPSTASRVMRRRTPSTRR